MHGLIANGALGPTLLAQREVVQHAWPAVDVAAARHVGRHWGIQADRTRRHLMTVDALCRMGKNTKKGSNIGEAPDITKKYEVWN